jgi:hypothetical protein
MCGLDIDGVSCCAACRAESAVKAATAASPADPGPDARSLVRAELAQIAARFEAADHRAKRAAALEDREAAEWERLEAAGDFWACESDLAHLFLLLIRTCLRHEPAALALYLAEALRSELEPLATALAKLESAK